MNANSEMLFPFGRLSAGFSGSHFASDDWPLVFSAGTKEQDTTLRLELRLPSKSSTTAP
jgi:hypothetical protein